MFGDGREGARAGVLTRLEDRVARERDAERKLKVHQDLLDVLLVSVDVKETAGKSRVGPTQFTALKERCRSMESGMDGLMRSLDTAYGEVEAWGEEGEELVRRVSRVSQRVSEAKMEVDAATVRRRSVGLGAYSQAARLFGSGVERHRVLGRRQWTEQEQRKSPWVESGGEEGTEVIDLESGSDEGEEEVIDVESGSDEEAESEMGDVESQEEVDSDDDIPE